MAGQDPSLGEWQEKWSETHNRVYYKNTVTGERQWKKPPGMMGSNINIEQKSTNKGHRASVDAYGIEELKRNGMFTDNANHGQLHTTLPGSQSEDNSSHTVEPVIMPPSAEFHRQYAIPHNAGPVSNTNSLNKLSKQGNNELATDNLTVVITDHTGRRRSITKTDPNAPTPPPPPPPPTSTSPLKSNNTVTPEEKEINSHLRRSSVSRRQSITPKQVDFPIICVKCFGSDPLVSMVKVVDGKNCFFCATSFTTFSFNKQKDVRKSASIYSTKSCKLCASMKDFCQICFGPMALNVGVTDEALKQVEELVVPILPYQNVNEIDEHYEAYIRRASITPQQAQQARRQSMNQNGSIDGINELPEQSITPQARRQSMNQYNKGSDSDEEAPTPSSVYPQGRRQSINKYYDGSNSNDAPPLLGIAPQGRRPSMGQPYEGSRNSEVLRRLSIQHQSRRKSINDASTSNNVNDKVRTVSGQSTTQQNPNLLYVNPNVTYQNAEDDSSSDNETKCTIA